MAVAAERSDSSGGAPAPALDLHEGIPDPGANGCPRWPETLRLRSSLGEVVRGRCRSTNQCAYCARLAAVENAELLAIDAMAGTAPEVWAVLTTRTATMDTAAFEDSLRAVRRAMKRRWPASEVARLVEFTTGYGPKSGGARRPHWNLLIKGVPAGEVEQLREAIVPVWCSRVDAEPAGQHVAAIGEAGGLMRYLALHFQKESQKPPAGWRGHRLTMTRGYLSTTTPEAREQARSALRFKRAIHRARAAGHDAQAAEQIAREVVALADATEWVLEAFAPATTSPVSATERGRPAPVPRVILAAAFEALVTGAVAAIGEAPKGADAGQLVLDSG